MYKTLLMVIALLVCGLQETVANDTTQKIDAYLSRLEKEKNFSGGLLIIKDGKAILSKGYGWADKARQIRFTPSTLASMGSITKAFTAAGMMKLVELQKCALHDPLNKYFPQAPADKAGITLHQLLTHSSGFHEFLQDDGGDYAKLDKAEFLKRAFAEPLAFKPGEKAVYTNVGMSILAIIIEEVSGLDYEAFLRQFLFDPIGCKIGYHFPVSPADTIAVGYQNGLPWGTLQDHFARAGGGPYWNLKGNGGLEASLNDILLWANAISDQKVLTAASIRTMFSPQVQEEGYGGQSYFGYGCNVSKSRRNTKMIDNGGSNGIYFARLIRLPEEGLVFYMVTNESSINTNKVLPNITQLYFQGKIVEDALAQQSKFESPISKQIYDLLEKPGTTNLGDALAKENIVVDDDMILLDVGQALINENKPEKALLLYQYYTKAFPKIVVAWNDMGDVYRMLQNNEAAKNCYQQALLIRPGNPRATENLEKLKR
ncbi:serine hydrolase domain-containing protein [Flavihumibacter fluvii]|uniref:serine hydrolase domain-containing protein n=1 Tax=Flavihumibacter fluvii TaxID=2838157 RepID=UPI001BDF2B67|nr:serine hydrolase domain-containing protein [Flavihumibacter fluvii]ULQ50992.1 serine hydrolase [Flavihumibacter fluvii]